MTVNNMKMKAWMKPMKMTSNAFQTPRSIVPMMTPGTLPRTGTARLANPARSAIMIAPAKMFPNSRSDSVTGLTASSRMFSGVARQPEAQGRMIPWLFTIVGLVEAMYFINLAFGFVFLSQVAK